MDGFNNLTEVLRRKGKITAEDFSGYMEEHCDHKWELASEICTGYERLSGKKGGVYAGSDSARCSHRPVSRDERYADSLAQELTGIEQAEFPLADRISSLLERENLSPYFSQRLHRSDRPADGRSGNSAFQAGPYESDFHDLMAFRPVPAKAAAAGGERSGKRIPSAVDRENRLFGGNGENSAFL